MWIDITIPESYGMDITSTGQAPAKHRPSRQGQADSLGFPEFLAHRNSEVSPKKIEGMDSPWKLVILT